MNNYHEFQDSYKTKKAALLAALEAESAMPVRRRHVLVRAAAIAALLSLLSAGAAAAVKLVRFEAEQNGDEVHISAGLDNNSADTSAPLRSWRAEDGEISIKLEFGWLPEGFEEDKTAPYKWGGDDITRAMTVSGIDLRRGDFDTTILHADTTEQLIAGGNTAYLITSKGAAVLYNKVLYILFEADELLVKVQLTSGISQDEVRRIAEGMKLSKTADTEEAMPIENEFSSASGDTHPEIFYHTEKKIYRDELLSIGEVGKYEFFDMVSASARVEGYEITDSISGLKPEYYLREAEWYSRFADSDGKLIPYLRTDLIRDESGRISDFGETVSVTKKLVLVTLTASHSDADMANGVKPFLASFDLAGFTENPDTSIRKDTATYVIDNVPALWSGTNSPIYREPLGNGRWVLGYLLDESECAGELLFTSYYASLNWLLD